MTFDLKRYFVLLCLGLSVGLNVFLWIFLAVKLPGASEDAILHYDATQGIDLIGPGSQIYILPLMGLFIIGLNFFLSMLSIKLNRLAAQILGGLAVSGQVILIVAALLLVNINR